MFFCRKCQFDVANFDFKSFKVAIATLEICYLICFLKKSLILQHEIIKNQLLCKDS